MYLATLQIVYLWQMGAAPFPGVFWYTLNTGDAIGDKNDSAPWNCWVLAIPMVTGMGWGGRCWKKWRHVGGFWCLPSKTFQSGNESLDQEKICQLGKVIKQNNKKELFREREACWRNLLWSWEPVVGALDYFRMQLFIVRGCWNAKTRKEHLKSLWGSQRLEVQSGGDQAPL